jgi:Glutathione S-transferase, C-terminal domain
MSWLVSIAQWTQPDFLALAAKHNRIQLLTIPYSHYVELARWTLQYSRVPFDEHKYAPLQHIFPILACRVHKGRRYYPSTTKMKIIRDNTDPSVKTEHSGATNVPVCTTPAGEVLVDSWSISERSGLKKCPSELQTLLDEELGPLVRHIVYCYILKTSNSNVWNGLANHKKGYLWKTLWWIGVGSLVTNKLKADFPPDNEELFNYARDKLRITMEKLGDYLRKSGGSYMLGNEVTVADIAVASLVAAVVNPELYAEGEYLQYFLLLEAQDKAYAAEVTYWRDTDIGKHCLFMYKQHRMTV